ncbi:hypothetical protein A9K75_09220 [Campylobacter fetus subsp. testudinum]|uniref:hypothetical protein n=1 Tax=Campylobacter fetus TaxID=196 RepID=UPI0008188B18|nr:hypothetical protein [Campylobacter fetus]OCR98943.1 hypothetical protein A9K75_09220 [Campylobacter fetus subsp. testudinum]
MQNIAKQTTNSISPTQNKDIENLKKQAEQRKKAREDRLQGLTNDMLSTKAMLIIFEHLFKNIENVDLRDYFKDLKDHSGLKVANKTEEILNEIKEIKEKDKEITIEILKNEKIKNLFKELDSNNFENNMNDLKRVIENGTNDLNVSFLLAENKSQTENININLQRNYQRK